MFSTAPRLLSSINHIPSASSIFLSIIEKLWFIKLLICSSVPIPPLKLITDFTYQSKPLSPSGHSWPFLSFKCNKIHQLHPTRKSFPLCSRSIFSRLQSVLNLAGMTLLEQAYHNSDSHRNTEFFKAITIKEVIHLF